ncbi:MAG: amidohydrolase [Xanthobacteraceae bacterium]|uniref:amidohydrolase family protein n=1 Tax=Pseudolabrys sp. TaxID=1960880 RepID=UPI003D117AA9
MIARGDDAPACLPPDPDPRTPALTLPPLACDAHFHVFGPRAVFPFSPQRTFTPQDAPKEALFALHRTLGIARGVFVQSACHGSDHAVVLDLLAAGQGRYRAVGLLTPDTPDADIARYDAAGMCGVRFHFFSHLGAPTPADDIRAVIAKVAPLGWHVAIHVGGKGVLEQYEFIAGIDAPVVIDHIGRIDVREGLDGAAFVALRRLLDRGNVWVKLSGTDRISREAYPYRDAVPFARTLVEHAPDRVVWGSDWPHPNHTAVPNDGDLVDLIATIAPDEEGRRKMMVDNPARLFGFGNG